MISYLLLPIFFSFLASLIFIPYWMKKARQVDLVWEDMNKIGSEKIPGSGGIIVVFAFILGSLLFVAHNTFIVQNQDNLVEIFALLTSILFLAVVGIVDDLLGWKRGGLSRRSRILLAGLAAIPFMVINAGKTVLAVPFFGVIDMGFFYPLVIVPLGIIGASTTFNFLAGFNGLEAGNGAILLSGMALVAYFTGNTWLAILCLCMAAALLAFLFFNFYPAKVFPGNSLTLSVGALIAIVAIVGNFEKIAVFFFIPYIIETVLKSRGKLIKQSFGKPTKEGSLDMPYNKIYGLTHFAIFFLKKINVRSNEKTVVYLIWFFQILVIILGFIIFNKGIFQ